VLPVQLFTRSQQRSPGQLLAVATLRQALADYAKSAKQPRWRTQIRAWIADDGDDASACNSRSGVSRY